MGSIYRIPVFIRADGRCLCPTCGKPYRKHPDDAEHLDQDGHTYLNVLCDGTKVKL